MDVKDIPLWLLELGQDDPRVHAYLRAMCVGTLSYTEGLEAMVQALSTHSRELTVMLMNGYDRMHKPIYITEDEYDGNTQSQNGVAGRRHRQR